MQGLTNWKNKVLLLWWIQFCCIATMEMSGPFWPLYFRDLISTAPSFFSIEKWASILGGMAYILPLLAAILSSPFWGKIGDRFGHKYMLMRAALALGLCQFALVYIQDPLLILLVRFIQGLCAGSIAACQSYAAKVSPLNERSNVFTKVQSATAAGSLIGPLFGGLLLETHHMIDLFYFASMIFLALLIITGVCLPSDNQLDKVNKKKAKPAQFDAAIWSPLIILVAICLAQMAKRVPHSFYALYVDNVLQQTSFMIGVLYAISGLGVLVASPIYGRYFSKLPSKQHKRQFLQSICFIAMILMLLQSQITSFYPALIIRFLWGVCLGGILPLLSAELSAYGGLKSIGKQVGISHSATKLGGVLGIAVGALIFAFANWQWGFCAIAFIYALMVYLLHKPLTADKKQQHCA